MTCISLNSHFGGIAGVHRWRKFISVLVLIITLAMGSATVFAVHDAGVFELDGDTVPLNAAPPVGPAEDFDNIFQGTSSAYDSFFVDDSPLPDPSVHFSGNKDGDTVPSTQRIYLNSANLTKNWNCIIKNNVTDKLDIFNTYYGAYNVGGAIAYFGADRKTTSGDANIGFWFFQDRVICDLATGTFTGNKRNGDILIVSPFTGGGGISAVDVYRWTDPDGILENGDEYLDLIISGGDCISAPAGDSICGTGNGSPITAAWRSPIPANGFFEGGINLSVLQPDTCYRTLMAETRSSQELSASLEDMVLKEIFTCGSISVEKVTDPSGDPELFDFVTAGGPTPVSDSFQLKDGDPTHATLNLLPGNYSVTETAPVVGWDLTGAKCRGGSFGTGASYNNGDLFTLSLGDKVVCTFVNTVQQPPPETSITVDKVTIPANHAQLFSFATAGGPVPISDSFQLTDADPSHPTLGLSAGTYTITETVPVGWDLTGVTCRGGAFGNAAPYVNGDPFALSLDDKVVCTFVNTLRAPPPAASITVDKVTNPGGRPDLFSFVTAGGPDNISNSFQLADATAPHITAPLKAGTYTVTETVLPGWTQSATCVGGLFGAGGVYVNGANIILSEGDQVTCTFTNSLPSITVDKVTIPSGASQQFSFITADGSISDAFQLTDVAAPHTTWVTPGTYSITETLPPGWALTAATCSGGPFGAGASYTNGAPFVVQDVDHVTCTFTNSKCYGSITIIKDAVPNDPQDFTFGGGLGNFSLDDDADPVLSNTKTFTGLAPGLYNVQEILPSGWNLGSIVCSDPTGNTVVNLATATAAINLDGCEAVTCKFTNAPSGTGNGFKPQKAKFTFYYESIPLYTNKDSISSTGYLLGTGSAFQMPFNQDVAVEFSIDPLRVPPTAPRLLFKQTIKAGTVKPGSTRYRYLKSGARGINELTLEKSGNNVYMYVWINYVNLLPDLKATLSQADYLAFVRDIKSYNCTVRIGNQTWSGNAPLQLWYFGEHRQQLVNNP
jgi:hypothetical protein